MTTPRIEKIGLVAHFSKQGDWAFRTALRLARDKNATLNVFYFLASPYEVPLDVTPGAVRVPDHDEAGLVQLDRALRERYDDLLGDFLEVGFRVCESGRHNLELRQCLKRKEYQLLVIPHLGYGASFGNMPLEEFAYRFGAPVLLVGPEGSDQYQLNPPALVLSTSYGLFPGPMTPIPEPERPQHLAVI